MDPKKTWLKSISKAAKAPGNLISGAVSLAASAALWNPLPLILWGLGSTAWVTLASTNEKFVKGVLNEEKRAREIQSERDREVLRQKVEAMLQENPVAGWMKAGFLPDYMAVYRRLMDIRDRIARVIHERREIDDMAEAGILQQLSYMLSAYLQFVRERVIYLQIIANVRPAAGGAVPPPPPPPSQKFLKRDSRQFPREAARPAAPLPNVEQRLADVDAKIDQLKELAKK
ncbi:MAG TPA: hypothetical protein VJ725_33160, partial [Thermoanaerobaculia bacterium]|nr:hypothetical protein [Thermoanaerobaculia bacterium]